MKFKSNNLITHSVKWSIPDFIEIPFKFIIYLMLLKFLTKEDFGILNIALLVFSYHGIFQFGVTDYIMIRLPKEYVKSNFEKMKILVNNSLGITLANSIIAAIIFVFLSYFLLDNSILYLALICYTIQSLFYEYYIHNIIDLRFRYHFNIILKIKVVFFTIRFLFSIAAIYFFGFKIYLILEALIFLIPILLFTIFRKKIMKPKLHLYKYLLKKGFPFFLISALGLTVSHIDRWIILGSLSLEVFATYSVIIYMVTAILIFPTKLLSIVVQYFKEYYTVVKKRFEYYNDMIYFMSIFLYSLLLFLLLVNYVIPIIVKNYLIEYLELIDLIPAALCLIILKFLVASVHAFLNLEMKQKKVLKTQILYLVFFVSLIPLVSFFFKFNLELFLWTLNAIFMIQLIYGVSLLFVNLSKSQYKKILIPFFVTIIFVVSTLTDDNIMILGHLAFIFVIALSLILNKQKYINTYKLIVFKKYKLNE